MANLMQEVDGLADQQNLYRDEREREREGNQRPGDSNLWQSMSIMHLPISH